MKHKDRQEVLEMIADAAHGIAGDFACYINYFNSRLEVLEELHGVEVENYDDFLKFYGTPEAAKRTIKVHLSAKGHHIIPDGESSEPE